MFDVNENEYVSFNGRYLEKTDGTKSIGENLRESFDEGLSILKDLSEEKQLYRYAEGKWTIKQLIEHIIDAERIFSYRALRIARNDSTDLAGFDENSYVPNSRSNKRDYQGLLDELVAVRKSTEILFANFDDDVLLRKGTVDGKVISVRVIGYVISGHLSHHISIIKERYLQ